MRFEEISEEDYEEWVNSIPDADEDWYTETCTQEVEIGEDDPFDRDPGTGLCGGKVVSTGGQSHYNGHYDCYTMYLYCDRCGDYEVECV